MWPPSAPPYASLLSVHSNKPGSMGWSPPRLSTGAIPIFWNVGVTTRRMRLGAVPS